MRCQSPAVFWTGISSGPIKGEQSQKCDPGRQNDTNPASGSLKIYQLKWTFPTFHGELGYEMATVRSIRKSVQEERTHGRQNTQITDLGLNKAYYCTTYIGAWEWLYLWPDRIITKIRNLDSLTHAPSGSNDPIHLTQRKHGLYSALKCKRHGVILDWYNWNFNFHWCAQP
jgi:hypothetical protein